MLGYHILLMFTNNCCYAKNNKIKSKALHTFSHRVIQTLNLRHYLRSNLKNYKKHLKIEKKIMM